MNLTRELKKSSCFSPRILRRQILDILVKELVQEDIPSASADAGPYALALQDISTRLLSPSIRHFHGALLFVDISGFTHLSQKMDVDNLRKFINAYFTKLIDIVSKYEGEVIKFAGDAMYIVWQSQIYGELIHKEEQIRIAVKKASVCAAEIIQVCSNYKVELCGDTNNTLNLNLAVPSKLNRTASRKASFLIATDDAANNTVDINNISGNASINANSDNFVAYLNVHCGLSVGMMSGLDIGSDGRWEYFIVGPPLKDVAEAEDCASSGEVMMTQAAHDLIHPSHEKHLYHCQCTLHPRGFWNLEQADVTGFSSLGRCASNDSGIIIPDDDEARHNLDLADDLVAGCREYYALFEQKYGGNNNDDGHHEQSPSKDAQTNSDKANTMERKPMGVSKLAAVLQHCLLDHLVLHTHPAVRSIIQMNFEHPYFDSNSESTPNSARLLDAGGLSPIGNPNESQLSSIRRAQHKASSTTFVNRMRELTRADSKKQVFDGNTSGMNGNNGQTYFGSPSKDKGIDIADQREAISCFINIQYHGEHQELLDRLNRFLHDEKMALSLPLTPYNFVVEGHNEEITSIENNAVQLYQQSFATAIENFHRVGGQIRQFIVDDKGTVVIGSFGLRGSVSRDNASSAVDTALRIISDLKTLFCKQDALLSSITNSQDYNNNMQTGMTSASIGITSGKVYNGLVGSAYRHEFAIMGPTVNMSARLMSQAPKNSILCDAQVKMNDHVHQFVHFADVKVKGYEYALPAFAPITTTASMLMTNLQPQIMEQIARQVDTDFNNVTSNSNSAQHVGLAASSSCSSALNNVSMSSSFSTINNSNAKMPTMRGVGGNNTGEFEHYLVGRKGYMSQMNEFLQDLACEKDIWRRILLQETLSPNHYQFHSLHQNTVRSALLSDTHERDASQTTGAMNEKSKKFLADAETRVILLEGIHGSGKSHLLHEVCNRIARYLDETQFAVNIAVHVLPQARLKQSEPFSSIRILLDTLTNRYGDWMAQRQFDPIETVEMSRRTKTKALRGLSALLEKLPRETHDYIPLFSIVNKHFVTEENDVTRGLSPIEKLHHLGHFLFIFLQTFQKEIGRLLFLNIDELDLMDRNSQELFKQLMHHGKGFVLLMVASAEAPLSNIDMSSTLSGFNKNSNTSTSGSFLRSNSSSASSSSSFCLKIRIEPLTKVDIKDMTIKFLTCSCLEIDISDEDINATVDHIYSFSRGNTLYVIEMLKSLRTQLLNPDVAALLEEEEYSPLDVVSVATGISISTKLPETLPPISLLSPSIKQTTQGTNGSPENSTHFNSNMSALSSRKNMTRNNSIRRSIVTGSNNLLTPTAAGVITPLLLENKRTIRQHLKKVEEVVAIRFGSLNDACQLLLKVMSVACAFGADTTPDMLAIMVFAFSDKAFFLFGNCENEAMLVHRIYEMLEKLLKSSEFLVRHEDDDGDKDGNGSLLLDQAPPSPTKVYVKSKSRTLSMMSALVEDHDNQSNQVIDITHSPSTATILSHTVSQDPSSAGMYCQSASTVASTLSALSTANSLVADHRRHTVHKYNFRLDLEQHVIFGMLLQEQRALLHQKAAEVYQRNHALTLHIPVTEMFDQALHWRACDRHAHALSCFYHAGIALVQQGAIEEGQEHLSMAYDMFLAMKTTLQQAKLQQQQLLGTKDALSSTSQKLLSGIGASMKMRTPMDGPSVLEMNDGNSSYEIKDLLLYLSRLFLRKNEKGNEPESEESLSEVLHDYRLTRKDVASMFQGDPLLLEECIDAISNLVYFKGFYGGLRVNVYMKLCEEVLELVVATLKIPSFTQKTSTRASILSNNSLEEGIPKGLSTFSSFLVAPNTGEKKKEKIFYLEDVSLCLPVIYHIFMSMFNFGDAVTVSNDQQFSVDRVLCCELFVAIARQVALMPPSVSANIPSIVHQPEDSRFHLAVALGNLRSVYLEAGRLKDAWTVMDEQLQVYDFATMHRAITAHYGYDQCPANIISIWKLTYLKGDLLRMEAAWKQIISFNFDTMEFRALELATVNLVQGLMLTERIEEAYLCIRKLITLMATDKVLSSLLQSSSNASFLRVGSEFLYILLRMMLRNKYRKINLTIDSEHSVISSPFLAKGTFFFDYCEILQSENPAQTPQQTLLNILREVVHGPVTDDIIVSNRLYERLSMNYSVKLSQITKEEQDNNAFLGMDQSILSSTHPSFMAYLNRVGFTEDGLYALFCATHAEYLSVAHQSSIMKSPSVSRELVAQAEVALEASRGMDEVSESVRESTAVLNAIQEASESALPESSRIQEYLTMGLFFSQRALKIATNASNKFATFNGCVYLLHRIDRQLHSLSVSQAEMSLLRDDNCRIETFVRTCIQDFQFHGLVLQLSRSPWAVSLLSTLNINANNVHDTIVHLSQQHHPSSLLLSVNDQNNIINAVTENNPNNSVDDSAAITASVSDSSNLLLQQLRVPSDLARYHHRFPLENKSHATKSLMTHLHREWSEQSVDTAFSCALESTTVMTHAGTTTGVATQANTSRIDHEYPLVDSLDLLVDILYPYEVPYYVIVTCKK